MKFLLSGIVLWVVLMGSSSCNKSFTCECTFQDTTKNFTVDISGVQKNEAVVTCNDYSQFVGTCKLK